MVAALARAPELCAEVALQPLERFALDAAILFSDILTVPDAMGLGLSFGEGEGPRFARPLRDESAVRALAAPGARVHPLPRQLRRAAGRLVPADRDGTGHRCGRAGWRKQAPRSRRWRRSANLIATTISAAGREARKEENDMAADRRDTDEARGEELDAVLGEKDDVGAATQTVADVGGGVVDLLLNRFRLRLDGLCHGLRRGGRAAPPTRWTDPRR